MYRRGVDPTELEGAALNEWFLRSPEDVEAEREQRRQDEYNAHFGPLDSLRSTPIERDEGDAEQPETWQEARVRLAPPVVPPRVIPTPRAAPAGPPLDGRAPPPSGSFFDRPDVQGAYFTNFAPPLDYVEAQIDGRVKLSNGKVVSAAEVERLASEQRRRVGDAPDFKPPARLRSVDRFKDGVIPRAEEIGKDERELDPTCHPAGGWERDPGWDRYPQWTKDYEAQITRAPGLDYVVRNPGEDPVKFDGCAVWDPRLELLEAKGPGHASLIARAMRSVFFNSVQGKAFGQAKRQSEARRGRPVDWHYAEPGMQRLFDEAVRPYPGMVAINTPPR